MGYFFNNIPQLANFLIDQPDVSGKSAPSSGQSNSNSIDFDSQLKAISGGLDPASLNGFGSGDINLPPVANEIESNRNFPGSLFIDDVLENPIPLLDSIANIDLKGGDSLSSPVVEKQAEVKSSEPTSLGTGLVKILLTENDDTVSIEISSNNSKQLFGGGANPRPTDILNESTIQRQTPVFRSVTEMPVNPNQSEKVLISFKAAELIRNMGNGADNLIKVGITETGNAVKSEYVDLSSLVDLIKKHPDPIKIEVPLLNDKGDNLPQNNIIREQTFKAAFAFDLRRIIEPDNVRVNNKTDGVLIFSGKPPDTNKRAIPDVDIKQESPAILKPLNSILSNEKQNSIDKHPLSAPKEAKISTTPAVSRGIPVTVSTGTRQEPLRNIKASEAKPIIETSGVKPGGLEQASDFAKSVFSNRDIASVNNSINTNTEILNSPVNRLLDIDEIRSGMIFAARRNQSTIRLKLHPEELGNLDIKLTVKQGILSADLKVSNIEAFKAINGRLEDLKAGLENFNLKVNEINVIHEPSMSGNHDGFGRNGMGADMWPGRNRGNGKFKEFDSMLKDDDSETAPQTSSQSTIHRGWVDLKA